jgi:hypothetical protein
VFVARRRVRLEARDEGAEPALVKDARGERLLQHRQQRAVARERAEIEQPRGRGQILLRRLRHLGDTDDVMSHAQPRVPERIEHGFDERQQRLARARGHEANVEVASHAEQAPAVAAHRAHQRRALLAGEARRREQLAHHPVDDLRVPARQREPSRAGRGEHRTQLTAVIVEVGTQRQGVRRAAFSWRRFEVLDHDRRPLPCWAESSVSDGDGRRVSGAFGVGSSSASAQVRKPRKAAQV